MARGITLPIHAYPLMENSLRADAGWSLPEHRSRIGALWSSFSEVAAKNPFAWLREPRSAAELVEPGPSNRMVAFPYTKLCTANLGVDQGAAYILCSVAAARAAGVPEERWVFPWSGAEAHDHWFLSDRPALHRSPAIELAGRARSRHRRLRPDDVGPVDLYSCFPVVVQVAARELGLRLGDPARPLTLTGGLTFAGGPGNNYASHGLATAVERLRAEPDAPAMVTGLGWYSTKHAITVLGGRPLATSGPLGGRWVDVQADVDALPRCRVDPRINGPVRIETYTVLADRDGAPDRGIAACRDATGSRTWASVTDVDALKDLTAEEGIGRTGRLDATSGVLEVD